MDVADVLRCAADAVDRSGVSGDLRAVAFTSAVELVLRAAGEAPLHREAPPSEAAPERPGGPALRLHGGEARPSAAREHPSYGEAARGDADGRPWDADHRADHRADWPESPRVLRPLSPLSSAGSPRSGVPRLAPRPDLEDEGSDWAGPRRGPERLVAVGPRTWSAPAGAGEEPWGSIADALGVRPELLDRVWEERSGTLQLAGDPARLGRTRAQRVGTAAVLLLAALRWSGRDGGEPVPDAVVRTEVERLGLLDTGNYTKHLAGRRHLLSTTGSGRTATYKLRYDGLEEARGIARALLEEG